MSADSHFSFSPQGHRDFDPWENSEPAQDAYEVALEHLNQHDQPHYAGVNKAEGGPFYGGYDVINDETVPKRRFNYDHIK